MPVKFNRLFEMLRWYYDVQDMTDCHYITLLNDKLFTDLQMPLY